MNKRLLTGLIIMMLLSVGGITWVQFTWISNAVVTQKDNFDKLVFMGLNNAARELESRSRMRFLNTFPGENLMPENDSVEGVAEFFSFGSTLSGDGAELKIDIRNNRSRVETRTGKDGVKSYVVISDSASYSDSVSVVVNPDGSVRHYVRKGGNPGENRSNGEIRMGKSDFEEWLKKRSGEFRNMSDRMIGEMYQWERNAMPVKEEVQAVLGKYLPAFGISTPFDFAVISDGKIESVSNEKRSKNDYLKSAYAMRLFPDNIFGSELVLSVVFPQKTNFVLGSMVWILAGSTLFSLFIIATFVLSLWFIVRQKKISEMKSDFINNMTHEFKTPIATISLAADTIMNPKVLADEKSIKHFVGMIKKENSRMNKKVETILQIASLDKKEIEFRFESTAVHSIIDKSVESFGIQVQERNGTISCDLKADTDIIMGDHDHLLSLMNNLIDNAVKYSADAPVVSISTINRDNGIVISVADRGIGMSKATQAKIFDRFFRQPTGNVHNVKGFGLGLNYVKDIVEAHKGHITVTSEPGKGSRFDIFLPLNCEN